MKSYQVVLTKSYLVIINADTEEQARRASEFYTSDIQDISSEEDRKLENFIIEEIESSVNEAIDCWEIKDQKR